MTWTTAQLITTGTSLAALLLIVVSFGLARRAERRRDELQRREDTTDADRLLDQAYDALYGPGGFAAIPNYRRLDEARVAVARARRLDPNSPRVVLYEGRLLEEQGDVTGAKQCYARVVAQDPTNAAAYLSLGRLTDGDPGIAILQDAVKHNPSVSTEVDWEIANKLAAMGRNDEAVHRYELAIPGRPRSIVARVRLASLLEQMGRTGDARAVLEEAVTLHPTSGPALTALGRLLSESGDCAAGYAMIEHATIVDPSNVEPYLLLARLHVSKQDAATARVWFDKAVRVKPTLYLQAGGRELARDLGLMND